MGSSLLSTLLMLLVGALVARLTAHRLQRWAVPAIVLELLMGVVLGHTVLPFARVEGLAGLTGLGVLTLFFQVGMSVPSDLRGSRPAAVLLTVGLLLGQRPGGDTSVIRTALGWLGAWPWCP